MTVVFWLSWRLPLFTVLLPPFQLSYLNITTAYTSSIQMLRSLYSITTWKWNDTCYFKNRTQIPNNLKMFVLTELLINYIFMWLLSTYVYTAALFLIGFTTLEHSKRNCAGGNSGQLQLRYFRHCRRPSGNSRRIRQVRRNNPCLDGDGKTMVRYYCTLKTMDAVGGCTRWSKVEAPGVVVVAGEDRLLSAGTKWILPLRMECQLRQTKISSSLQPSSGLA